MPVNHANKRERERNYFRDDSMKGSVDHSLVKQAKQVKTFENFKLSGNCPKGIQQLKKYLFIKIY